MQDSSSLPSLQRLAMLRYLDFVESGCAAYVQLVALDSPFTASIPPLILSGLKKTLSSCMSGVSSSTLRGEMLELVMSGKFPSNKYKFLYSNSTQGGGLPDDPLSDGRATSSALREHGRACCSPCCTGVYIVETMACVIANDEIRELKFDFKASDRIWDKHKLVRKYIPLDLPSIFSHYQAALSANRERRPQLERLVVRGTDIQTRRFAFQNYNMHVLNMYEETSKYYSIPRALSAAAKPDSSFATCPFSEDLIFSLCDVFQFGRGHFDKLTEIQLGREVINTNLDISDPSGRPINVELFSAIGTSCPNLRVLDVAGAINLSADCFIHLFFHDTYKTLHKYTYHPPHRVDTEYFVVQQDHVEPEDMLLHTDSKYCPWCADPWCGNGVRAGCEFMPVKMPVIDDRLYDWVRDKHYQNAPCILKHVLKASDLVKAITDPIMELVRPSGPLPWEPDFDLSLYRDKVVQDGNYCAVEPYTWIKVEDEEDVSYRQAPSYDQTMKMNDLCSTLQVVKLNSDSLSPKHELVPFLLAALPQVRSLGNISVLRGLKMIRRIPGLGHIRATGLRDIEISMGLFHSNKVNANWAPGEIAEDIEEFASILHPPPASVDERRAQLADDIQLVAAQCPALVYISLFLFLDPPCLRAGDSWLWEPLASLQSLKQLTLHSHQWEDVSSLIQVVGPKLEKLYLALDGRNSLWEDEHLPARVPELDTILEACKLLHTLTVSFGIKPLRVTLNSGRLNLSKLTKLTVHTYMTKGAFEWLWINGVNLVELSVTTIVNSDNFPADDTPVVYDTAALSQLFRKNLMRSLKVMKVNMTCSDIPSATYLLDQLLPGSPLESLGQIVVKVQLSQIDYDNHDDLLAEISTVMQLMRKFKLDCEARGRGKINWRWKKVGLLESFTEIEQLNHMIEPIEQINQ